MELHPTYMRRNMNRFSAKLPHPSGRATRSVTEIPKDKEIVVFLGEGSGSARATYNFRCAEYNLTLARGESDPDQRSMFYFGAALSLLPELDSFVQECVGELGLKLTIMRMPRDIHLVYDPFPEVTPDVRSTTIKMSILLIFLYKNINPVNYQGVSENRLKALASICSHSVAELKNTSIFAETEHATDYRRILGGCFSLKRGVLQCIHQHSTGPDMLSRALDHVCGITYWSDMSPLAFINVMLLIPNSPVLREPEVAGEVLKLATAMAEVCTSNYPQYYRILELPYKHRVLERSNFPILLAVSQKLAEEVNPTVAQFVKSSNVKPELVERLTNIHKLYFQGAGSVPRRLNIEGAIEGLTNYSIWTPEASRRTTENTDPREGPRATDLN